MKRALRSIAAAIAVITISLALLELALRLYPLQITGYDTDLGYQPDRDVGYVGIPDQQAVYSKACFSGIESSFNSAGFRDGEWSGTGGGAFLGDSFVQASEVGDDITTAGLFERLSGIEARNVGIQGHGTVSERVMYRKFIKPLRPDFVVLFFVDNDFSDNYCPLGRRVGTAMDKPCLERDGSTYAAFAARADDVMHGWLRDFVRANCYLCRALHRLPGQLSGYDGELTTGLPLYFRTYDPAFTRSDADFAAALDLTLQAIAALRDEVEADGARFYLLHVPSHIEITDDIARDFGHRTLADQEFADLSPGLVRSILRRFSDENDIRFLDLKPYLERYRDTFDLGFPYFTFACDKHFNPVGHAVMAAGLYQLLKGEAFAGTERGERLAATLLQSSPAEILGSDSRAAIYGGGRFTGDTALPEVIGIR